MGKTIHSDTAGLQTSKKCETPPFLPTITFSPSQPTPTNFFVNSSLNLTSPRASIIAVYKPQIWTAFCDLYHSFTASY